jgi:hypothetical protein
MEISIENNLVELKRNLESKGYVIHNFSERLISDVYIYSEENPGLINLFRNLPGNLNGSLVINAYGKTDDEIVYSIKNRIYSPLF